MRVAAVMCASLLLLSSCDSKNEKNTVAKAAAMQSAGEPVNFEVLKPLLPVMSGWEKKEVTGMMLAVPLKGAQVSERLVNGNAEVVVDIIDTVFNQSLYAPVAAFMEKDFSSSDANGYKRAITFQNEPAFQEWSSKDQTGGLTVLAGKRFLVHLRGKGLNSIEPLLGIASQINIAQLAALK